MSDGILKMIQAQHNIVKKYFLTCKEINIAFIPYEEQVITKQSNQSITVTGDVLVVLTNLLYNNTVVRRH